MKYTSLQNQVILVDRHGNRIGMTELLEWAKAQGYDISCNTDALLRLWERYREAHGNAKK